MFFMNISFYFSHFTVGKATTREIFSAKNESIFQVDDAYNLIFNTICTSNIFIGSKLFNVVVGVKVTKQYLQNVVSDSKIDSK